MEFKYINDRHKTTPKKVGNSNCNPPSSSPKYCTPPPSKFAKIYNPFGPRHLCESPYTSTFSPNVFATPKKEEEKFKWTIDDYSRLRPADIDEESVSQHAHEEDPHMEIIVQKNIDKFFKEKMIVPSPMSPPQVQRIPLVCIDDKPKEMVESSTQTMLSLPFHLPESVHEALKPYLNEPQEECSIQNTPFYQKLFDESIQSSPAKSTGLSPLNFSPTPEKQDLRKISSSFERVPELQGWKFSPIPRESLSRSVCRLDFSAGGSCVEDCSMTSQHNTSFELGGPTAEESLQPLGDSPCSVNWDMEYECVSFVSPQGSPPPDRMELTRFETPHSKFVTSQRKRLSDSFKFLEDEPRRLQDEEEEPDMGAQVFVSTPGKSAKRGDV